MKIATWNVNSIRARIEHIENFLREEKPDVLCIQETKVQDKDFPLDNLKEEGYFAVFSGQKSYNGVAILSRLPFKNVKTDLFDANGQKRTIELVVNDVTIINGYYPRGAEKGEDYFFFKLEFFEKMINYLTNNHSSLENIVLCGDFNVASGENDVWDAELLQNAVGFLKEERDALRRLMDFGFVDIFRKFSNDKVFTWWDYRGGSFRKNEGMRIDYILATIPVAEKAVSCEIKTSYRKLKRPSDHVPVVANFELS